MNVPSLEYRVGDLFAGLPTDRPVVIPHVCNDSYVMGAGFVVPLTKRWPEVFERYAAERPPLACTQHVKVAPWPEIAVANMVAQSTGGRRPLRYSALVHCMEQVAVYAEMNNMEIHSPLFGAGLAGGDWNTIEALIEELWRRFDVVVWQLPGQEQRPAGRRAFPSS